MAYEPGSPQWLTLKERLDNLMIQQETALAQGNWTAVQRLQAEADSVARTMSGDGPIEGTQS